MSSPSPELFARLASPSSKLRPDTWYLLAAVTATALGQAPTWIPAVYQHAVASLGPAPAQPSTPPVDYSADPLPRRRVVRRLKEALIKSMILIGVPRVIDASLKLCESLEPGDTDTSFVRETFGQEDNETRGRQLLHTVYPKSRPFDGPIGTQVKDLDWLSLHATYGLILAPIAETHPSAPLTFAETEIVIMTCMIAQKAKQAALWHMASALRCGLTEEEVEAVQQAVEAVAAECGVDVRSGMPRVTEAGTVPF